MTFLVLVIVFISGFTGLIYQVVWQKYLSIYLGSHALSTSLTLSCFFLFLALGYQIMGRFGHKLGSNRILSYAYLEGLIGVYAIVSPAVFRYLYEVWPSYPSHSFLHFASSGFFALLLIGFPTFLMGGTIPLLTQGMSQELEEGHKVHAWVYGLNTLGAFVGTLTAGFILIEWLGLAQSLNMTGILNCLICVLLIVYCRVSSRTFEGFEPEKETKKAKHDYRLLGLAFLSGFISFGLENIIIRLAGLTVGSSNYTYTVIVAAFILSIALGSIAASRSNSKTGLRWLICSQAGLMVSLTVFVYLIPSMPGLLARVRLLFSPSEINFIPYWVTVFFTFQLLVLAPVFFLGMTLPLLFQQLKRRGQFLNQTAGLMYAVNSIGAVLGSILLGYLAFFFLDVLEVFFVIILLTGFCVAIVLSVTIKKKAWAWGAIPLVLALLFPLVVPKWQDSDFVPGQFFGNLVPPKTKEEYLKSLEQAKHYREKEQKILYSDFGVNTYTVVVETSSGDRAVFVNGKPDAHTRGDQFTRSMTALLPLSISKANSDIFIIGLGSGLSAGIAASFYGTETIKVAEIANGVIHALPFFDKWNFNLKDNMDKVTVVNDDAYKVLKTEEKKYDIIFSEPSNTWVTGVEKIYTFEFLNEASGKLKKDGIYSQWFPLFAMSEPGFLSILFNFKRAFKNVTLWGAGGAATIIMASNDDLSVNLEQIKKKADQVPEVYSSVKRQGGLGVLYHQLLTDPAVTDLAKRSKLIHSLYHPTLAYQSGRAFFQNTIIHHETLANKYFVMPVKEKDKINDMASKFPVQPHGPDKLLWEQVKNQLPESFYKEGIEFLLKVDPLFAGRLSLAREDQYGGRVAESSSKGKSKKMQQYQFLLESHPKTKPKSTSEELPLATELFERYRYLLAMRKEPYIENVLQTVPKKCDEEVKKCLQNKLTISTFLNPKLEAKKEELSKSIERDPKMAKKIVETIYETEVRQL